MYLLDLAWQILRTARPRQWLKNGTVAAALVFSGQMFVRQKFWATVWAIVVFILISSAVYLFNDVMDRQSDRRHPFKRLRPVAAGKLAVWQALAACFTLLAVGLSEAFRLSIYFALAVITYLIVQLLYSLWLKHIAIVDLLLVASGFILRVYAGALVIDAHLSIWFLLCVVSVALLISVGKRRAELAILTENVAAKHRKVLSKYPPEVLNGYVAMFANASFLSWSLFTFFEPPAPIVQANPNLFSELPKTIAGTNKWLMSTIPLVIYGLMRYMRIIYQGSRAESPERVLWSDRPLLITVMLWGLMIITILYLVPGMGVR